MTISVTRTEHTADDLRRHAARTDDAAIVRRLLALALVLDGRKRADAARLAGMDRQTLRDWVHRYNADGMAGLEDRYGGGRKPRLSAAQEDAVQCRLAQLWRLLYIVQPALTLTGPGQHQPITTNSVSLAI